MRDKLNKILAVTNNELNNLDYGKYSLVTDRMSGYQGYFFLESGKEHYRLLSYISTLYNDENIFDIGTYKGFSALALSHNPTNKVISYDILEDSDLWYIKYSPFSSSMEYMLGDCTLDERLLKSNFISLDTAHDGVYEEYFLSYLAKNNWQGLLLMDDIHEYPALKDIWQSITKEKYDLTNKGHWSGTGLVVFE